MSTKRHGSFALQPSTNGKNKNRRRWYCNSCRRAFTPYQSASGTISSRGYRAVDLYFDSKASYRDVARQLGVHRNTAYRLIAELTANCKSPLETSQQLKPRWSGYLLVDGDVIDVGAQRKVLLIAVDSLSQDILHARLVHRETGRTWTRFFSELHQSLDYQPPGIVSDGFPAIVQGIRAVYPDQLRQQCVRHFAYDFNRLLRYRFTQKRGHWRQSDRLGAAVNRMLYAPSLIQAHQHLESMITDPGYRRAGLSRTITHVRKAFPDLVTHHACSGMPRTNSIVEGVISRLDERIDLADGYGSDQTCWATLKMWIMWYRFKKFTDCKKNNRQNNGKAPLQLAGIDTSEINWIRFSQRLKKQQ
jgi:transposase-like protein